jgi:hypothetical protein
MTHWPRKSALLTALVALAGAALAGALLLALASGGGSDSHEGGSPVAIISSGASLDSRFAALSGERTNRCDLRAGELRQMPDEAHLQGSCCFPMERDIYAEQLHDLRPYRDIEQIPPDPYDVPVALAKRLLSYREIPLTQEQRHTYRQAMRSQSSAAPAAAVAGAGRPSAARPTT